MESFSELAKNIKLLILDVDGVLTDGRIYVHANGEESYCFHVHDGFGMKQLQKSGIEIAIISARNSPAVLHRLKQLHIQHIYLGTHDKLSTFETILQKLQLSSDQVAYMGDDCLDIPVMQKVALSITVANAMESVKKIAHFCTQKKGGKGAVREVCDFLICSQTIIVD